MTDFLTIFQSRNPGLWTLIIPGFGIPGLETLVKVLSKYQVSMTPDFTTKDQWPPIYKPPITIIWRALFEAYHKRHPITQKTIVELKETLQMSPGHLAWHRSTKL